MSFCHTEVSYCHAIAIICLSKNELCQTVAAATSPNCHTATRQLQSFPNNAHFYLCPVDTFFILSFESFLVSMCE